jgi:hypothetical protein
MDSRRTTLEDLCRRFISAEIIESISGIDVECSGEEERSISINQVAEKYLGEKLNQAISKVEIREDSDSIILIGKGTWISKVLYLVKILILLFFFSQIGAVPSEVVPCRSRTTPPKKKAVVRSSSRSEKTSKCLPRHCLPRH